MFEIITMYSYDPHQCNQEVTTASRFFFGINLNIDSFLNISFLHLIMFKKLNIILYNMFLSLITYTPIV